MPEKPKEPWYADGLAFTCQNCGDCCRGPGGYVWVVEEEVAALAKRLNMPPKEFSAKMLRTTLTGIALVDDARGNCPFLGDDGRCIAYEERPRQCRTWPWWEENLASPQRWENAAKRCPGMNRGEKHSRLVIDCEKAKDF